jgi:anhydro-N-acetylmuramic acid kinase
LRQRLRVYLPPETALLATDEAGVSSDFKEAIAFAVLAYWRFGGSVAGNLPLVTGAKQPMLLGEVHLPVGSHFRTSNFIANGLTNPLRT